MGRLNITLQPDTLEKIDKHAKVEGKARAAVARELLLAALERHERLKKLEKLARDYAQCRQEISPLLADFEAGQLEILDD